MKPYAPVQWKAHPLILSQTENCLNGWGWDAYLWEELQVPPAEHMLTFPQWPMQTLTRTTITAGNEVLTILLDRVLCWSFNQDYTQHESSSSEGMVTVWVGVMISQRVHECFYICFLTPWNYGCYPHVDVQNEDSQPTAALFQSLISLSMDVKDIVVDGSLRRQLLPKQEKNKLLLHPLGNYRN